MESLEAYWHDYLKSMSGRDSNHLPSLSVSPLDQTVLENYLENIRCKMAESCFEWLSGYTQTPMREYFKPNQEVLMELKSAIQGNQSDRILEISQRLFNQIGVQYTVFEAEPGIKALAIQPNNAGVFAQQFQQMEKTIGLQFLVFCPKCLEKNNASGMYDSHNRALYLSNEAVLNRKFGPTEYHELRHAIVDRQTRIRQGHFLQGVVSRSKNTESSLFRDWGYRDFMSFDELSAGVEGLSKSLQDLKIQLFNLVQARQSAPQDFKLVKTENLKMNPRELKANLPRHLHRSANELFYHLALVAKDIQTLQMNSANLMSVIDLALSDLESGKIKPIRSIQRTGSPNVELNLSDNMTKLTLNAPMKGSAEEVLKQLKAMQDSVKRFYNFSKKYKQNINKTLTLSELSQYLASMKEMLGSSLQSEITKISKPQSYTPEKRWERPFNASLKLKSKVEITENSFYTVTQVLNDTHPHVVQVELLGEDGKKLWGIFAKNSKASAEEVIGTISAAMNAPFSVVKPVTRRSGGVVFNPVPNLKSIDTVLNEMLKIGDNIIQSQDWKKLSQFFLVLEDLGKFGPLSYPTEALVFEKGQFKFNPVGLLVGEKVQTGSALLNEVTQKLKFSSLTKMIEDSTSLTHLMSLLKESGIESLSWSGEEYRRKYFKENPKTLQKFTSLFNANQSEALLIKASDFFVDPEFLAEIAKAQAKANLPVYETAQIMDSLLLASSMDYKVLYENAAQEVLKTYLKQNRNISYINSFVHTLGVLENNVVLDVLKSAQLFLKKKEHFESLRLALIDHTPDEGRSLCSIPFKLKNWIQ